MKAEPISWDRVEPILDRLLALAPAARAAAIPLLCGSDEALRREVEALFTAHERAGDFLETSAAAFAARHRHDAESADLVGTRIGPWRLTREIGRGGMGTVWLAERDDGEFQQQGALKLVKRGMDSDEILARFRRERQILARLEHPNIARLLDGGVSPDGRPFFVMEYVPGEPLTRYAAAGIQTFEERLRLFVLVCRALQYAHRNLVVHRDLKPGNVLVTEDGAVKLLDFGVAKLLGQEEERTLTAPGPAGRPMTPEYASPEQVLGLPVTTASDIYQLGVLLYELLTGERPYQLAGRSAREIERSVCESQPSAPSTRMAGGARKRLRGDLDAIVMRTLRKEPEQRYPSAEALADDLERHLAHRPLRFGGGAFRYRTGKFVRRNRGRLALGTALAITVLGMTTAYTIRIREQRDLARQGESKAVESAALLRRFFQGWSPDAANRGEVNAGKMLDDAARRAEAELAGDPQTLASILSTLGELQASLGRLAIADSLLGRALVIQEGLPGSPGADLGATLARRGRLYLSTARFPEAELVLRRALAAYGRRETTGRTEVLMAQADFANALWQQNKLAESEAVLREALARVASPEAPITTELSSHLGYVLFFQGRNEEAVPILRQVLDRQRRIFGPVHLSTGRTIRSLASALRDQGRLAEAERHSREAVQSFRSLYGEEHGETISALIGLALVLEREGKFADAEAVARTSTRLAEVVFGQNLHLMGHLRTLAAIRMAQGDRREAEQLLRRALLVLRLNAPEGNPDEGDVLNRLCWLALVRRAPDADTLYFAAARFEAARLPEDPWFVTDGYEFLGEAARLKGDSALARRMFERAVGLYRRQLPPGHPYRVMAERGLQ